MVRQALAEQNFAGECEGADGWYLLRRGASFNQFQYRAGALVERVGGAWYVEAGTLGEKKELRLAPWMVCEVSYDGVSLYVVECDAKKVLHVGPVLGSLPLERVDPMLVAINLQPGESCVCARFGRCFLPLEFFGW